MMGPGPGPGGGYELDDNRQLEIERNKNKNITEAFNKLSSNHKEALDICTMLYKKCKKLKKKNKKLKEKNRALKAENKELHKALEYNIHDAFIDLKNGRPSHIIKRPKPLPKEVKLGLDEKGKREKQRAREKRNED